MDLNFFTWNVKNNQDTEFYKNLNKELIKCDVDIVVLQECLMDAPIAELQHFDEIPEFLKEGGSRTVRIFLNRNSGLMDIKATSFINNKLRCVRIKVQNGYLFNLAAVHMYSKTLKSDIQQYNENITLGGCISDFEQSGDITTRIKNTIVVGDLNYHPFEEQLQTTFIFNAINDKAVISSLKTRRFAGQDYPFYYNPMWNLLGDYDYVDKAPKVPGTYYHDANDSGKYHWNLFDGVILSSQMMHNLKMETLKVVTQINSSQLIGNAPSGDKRSFLTAGFSDHLPVKFTIKTV